MTSTGFSVEVDSGQVDEALALFTFLGGNSSDAIRVGTNKALPKVKTLSSRTIRSQVRLLASYVNDRLSVFKATRSNLTGRISAASRGILLSRYSTDSNVRSNKVSWVKPPPLPARGARVKVKPNGGTQAVSGGPGEISGKPFYLVLRNSRQLAIAGRRSKLGAEGGRIKVFYAPSVSQVFSSVREEVLTEASEIHESEVLNAISFLLRKQFPK